MKKIHLNLIYNDYITIIRTITEELICYGTYKGYLGILNANTKTIIKFVKIVNYNWINDIIFISNNKLLISSTFYIRNQECGIFDMETDTFNLLLDLKFESHIHIEKLIDSKLLILSKNVSNPNLTDITIFDMDRYQIENIIHINIEYSKIKNCLSKISDEIIYGFTDGNIYIYR